MTWPVLVEKFRTGENNSLKTYGNGDNIARVLRHFLSGKVVGNCEVIHHLQGHRNAFKMGNVDCAAISDICQYYCNFGVIFLL